jgi:hypothetical protein
VADCGTPLYSSWDGKTVDNYRLGLGNVFETKEEAEKHAEYLKAISKVTNYCYENDLVLTDIDWEDADQKKYFIIYTSMAGFADDVTWVSYKKMVLPYLKSKEACEKVIEEMEDELKIIFNVK